MSNVYGRDETGYAFPLPKTDVHPGQLGMTYRQWLAGQIGARLMADPTIIRASMRRFNSDDDLTRKKMAQSVWMLVDYLIAEEHTGWLNPADET